MAITLSSDYIYVVAMLKTTPLVVTIGLSLTMPLAVLGDVVLQHPVKAQVVLGAALVLVSFVVIGLEDSKAPPEGKTGVQDEMVDEIVDDIDQSRQ
jgi:solute carrier family 35 protein F5